MSKLEKLNKLRLSLIILISLLLLIMLITIFILAKVSPKTKHNAGLSARGILNYNCLKKGEICNKADIMNSVKIAFQVNGKETYDFYLIANDENTATFMMASNIKDNVDWHIEELNFRGPTKAYRELMLATKDWVNIPQIKSFLYEDAGNLYYHETCDTIGGQSANLLYDCSNTRTPARGYKLLEITEDGLYLDINVPEGANMDETIFYEAKLFARLPSYEELSRLSETELPEWLIDNLAPQTGYWTMTSSTYPSLNYNKGAYALVNDNGKVRLIETPVMNEVRPKYNIGIRPVITIGKY